MISVVCMCVIWTGRFALSRLMLPSLESALKWLALFGCVIEMYRLENTCTDKMVLRRIRPDTSNKCCKL